MKRSIRDCIMAAAVGESVEWQRTKNDEWALVFFKVGPVQIQVQINEFTDILTAQRAGVPVEDCAEAEDEMEVLKREIGTGALGAEALRPYVTETRLAWAIAELIDNEGRPALVDLLKQTVPEPRG